MNPDLSQNLTVGRLRGQGLGCRIERLRFRFLGLGFKAKGFTVYTNIYSDSDLDEQARQRFLKQPLAD